MEVSEYTLDLVVEAPTLKAALTAAPKVVVSDLDWELYDYRWGDEPTVRDHAEAGADAVPDFITDAEGNLVEVVNPPMPAARRPGIRIVREDD
jgi:hypothetical protein